MIFKKAGVNTPLSKKKITETDPGTNVPRPNPGPDIEQPAPSRPSK